jgi:hypothetical protein
VASSAVCVINFVSNLVAHGVKTTFSGVGVGVGFSEGDVEGVDGDPGAAFLTTTPLSQINFFPLLMQVNFLPFEFFIEPALLHTAPAFGGVAATA